VSLAKSDEEYIVIANKYKKRYDENKFFTLHFSRFTFFSYLCGQNLNNNEL